MRVYIRGRLVAQHLLDNAAPVMTPPMLALLILPMLKITLVNTSTTQIVDSAHAFPYLRSVNSPHELLKWDSGISLQQLNSCKLIRITRRGVRCIAASDQLLTEWELAFSRHEGLGLIQTTVCMPANDALCVTSDGMRFFPTNKVFVDESSVGRCRNGQGRVLVADKIREDERNFTSNLTIGRFSNDVSLCDVLDTNLDIIYDPVHNRIVTAQLSDSAWLYSCISVLLVTVVVLAAETVSQRERSNLTHNIIAWIMLGTASLLMLTHVDGRMHPFVSVQDRDFIVISGFYIGMSTFFWIYTSRSAMCGGQESDGTASAENATETVHTLLSGCETQRGGINSMLASIHFATCVLYGTPDNAYVVVFFFLFLLRCLQKLHDTHENPEKWTLWASCLLLLDVVYTALIFSFGVIPHYTKVTDTTLYAAAQYMICDAIAANSVISVKKMAMQTTTRAKRTVKTEE